MWNGKVSPQHLGQLYLFREAAHVEVPPQGSFLFPPDICNKEVLSILIDDYK